MQIYCTSCINNDRCFLCFAGFLNAGETGEDGGAGGREGAGWWTVWRRSSRMPSRILMQARSINGQSSIWPLVKTAETVRDTMSKVTSSRISVSQVDKSSAYMERGSSRSVAVRMAS